LSSVEGNWHNIVIDENVKRCLTALVEHEQLVGRILDCLVENIDILVLLDDHVETAVAFSITVNTFILIFTSCNGSLLLKEGLHGLHAYGIKFVAEACLETLRAE